MRFFGASPWRFPSLLHARGETTGAATQRSMPSVLHLRTGVRIPPPPLFDSGRGDREFFREVASPCFQTRPLGVGGAPRPRMLARHPRSPAVELSMGPAPEIFRATSDNQLGSKLIRWPVANQRRRYAANRQTRVTAGARAREIRGTRDRHPRRSAAHRTSAYCAERRPTRQTRAQDDEVGANAGGRRSFRPGHDL